MLGYLTQQEVQNLPSSPPSTTTTNASMGIPRGWDSVQAASKQLKKTGTQSTQSSYLAHLCLCDARFVSFVFTKRKRRKVSSDT